LAQRFEQFHSLKSLAGALTGSISSFAISFVVEAIPLMYFLNVILVTFRK
jgi:hypothetical protein